MSMRLLMPSVAYLANRYPEPSHTFIRTEITAIERLGITVHRFSHRVSVARWLADADLAERRRTTVLTHVGAASVIHSFVLAATTRPIRLLQSLCVALAMGWRTGRIPANIGYVLLACVLGRRMQELGISHVHAHMATNPAAVAMFC